ncbi:regulator of MON1-CCZ1 complex-like isoform X4 [Eriocheir sinensis]|uniref:regulator of MON1-CCZ1 complex-like isoform X3 n=1 Tax=Eriocheir sinensis TaxID=95602 RepID=UPI0021C7EA01|nr:regulator of MON1-CCZ1 complex-like isoform X3 [Eriocheir sinensis]XP_050703500.1 regulator of MON1-CCZ1 complex-like isoform X4 [Eriocheir sinensis]
MGELGDTRGYLELSKDPVRFEPVSKVTNVFFDDTSKEVLSVRGGGTLGVVVRGQGRDHTFRMEDKGPISSLKFSPDHTVLAVQRSKNAVELLSYSSGEVGVGLTQECRAKSATLLGFIWTNSDDLALITDHGVEYYQVTRERLAVRHLRSYSIPCTWFVWSPECSLLLLCCGSSPSSTTLQPFSFKPGQSTKMAKFEVEVSGPGGPSAPGVTLGERDVCVGWVYGQPSVCVLRHPASPSVTAALDVYTQNRDNQFKKTYTCRLELTGRFAVNIIDSLIVVHHQASKTSLLFDVLVGGGEGGGGVTWVFPLPPPRPVQPFALVEAGALPCPATQPQPLPCELYAPTWVVFQPDIVIDARLGCMWHLQLRLDCLAEAVQDKTQLIDCLLRRKQAKSLVLLVVRKVVESGQLACLGQIFDKINAAYRQHLNTILQSQMGESVSFSGQASGGVERRVVVVEQPDMYSAVLAPLMEEAEKVEKEGKGTVADRKVSVRAVVGVVVEYVRSLGAVGVTVQHFLYELVITALVRTQHFYQLHQLLQYHVLADSKPLACLLLSLVGRYSAGQQLSLDMLCRLNTAHDEIIEVLLSQHQVTPALRYARSVGLVESVSARKFLEAAMASGDDQVFYSTFTFFSLRNTRLRGNAAFARGEHCEVFVEHFKKLFGELPDYSNQQL